MYYQDSYSLDSDILDSDFLSDDEQTINTSFENQYYRPTKTRQPTPGKARHKPQTALYRISGTW